MDITINNIKSLREKSGAGMVDCKKALEESAGDIDNAIDILRKKGIAKAAKREGHEAGEGIILIDVNLKSNEGYILEINSETDFVARNDKFKEFSKKVLELIKSKKPENLDILMKLKMESDTVKNELDNLSGIIGEKLNIKRFEILLGKTVAGYSHMGGKIGVLISFNKEEKHELAVDIAMQVAAANPKYIRKEDVSDEEKEKEKEIYREQLKEEGKEKNIIDKILEGKINKYFEEICLFEQEFIKDDKKKIKDVLGDVDVNKFIRYSL